MMNSQEKLPNRNINSAVPLTIDQADLIDYTLQPIPIPPHSYPIIT
jgi:hypothetical protein